MGVDDDFSEPVNRSRDESNLPGGWAFMGRETQTSQQKSFKEIQSELNDLTLAPDQRTALEGQRRTLVRNFGAFARDYLLQDLPVSVDAQMSSSTWDTVYPNLLTLALETENDVSGMRGYNPNYEGITSTLVRGVAAETREVGLANKGTEADRQWREKKRLMPAAINTLNSVIEEADAIEDILREIVDPNFELMPQDVLALIKPDRQVAQNQPVGNAPQDLPFNAETFARMMGQGTPEEQKELYLKAEETMVPMQMDLQVPNFLLGADRNIRAKEQREWKARAALSSMAGHKRMAPGYDKQFPNQAQIDFSGEFLTDSLGIQGTMEIGSFYTYCIARNADISFLRVPNPKYVSPEKWDANTKPIQKKQFTTSFFEISTAPQFAEIRGKVRELAVRNWDLENLGEARDAEQVAWNLIFSGNVVEEFDSIYAFGLEDRIPPAVPQLKALTLWMMMHPQERLAAKAGDPNKRENQEAMGVFGEWAVNRTRSTGSKLDVEVLPRKMFENALKGIKASVDGEELTLFDIFVRNGEVLFGQRVPENWVSTNNIEWGGMETPFASYQFDSISPAIKVFDVVMKGKDSGVDLLALGTVCRKLKLDNDQREKLLMAWWGIKAQGSKLSPKIGAMDWIYAKNAVKKNYPGFFS
ncbi:MAG: hypothetical protein AAB546_00470 [Patescibacteria group bacterium]